MPRRARPKTAGQRRYVSAIRDNEITFGIGPAGTGKTYLAVAMAVQALKDKRVKRIVLTRPAVEAGERLGFLPGDLQAIRSASAEAGAIGDSEAALVSRLQQQIGG